MGVLSDKVGVGGGVWVWRFWGSGFELGGVDEPHLVGGAVVFEVVDIADVLDGYAVAASAVVQVFKVNEAFEVSADLHVVPLAKLPKVSATKEGKLLFEAFSFHFLANQFFDGF